MKCIKYWVILAILIIVASCTESEIVEMPTNRGSQIQIAGRVIPFADRNVNSRAIKVGDETNIVSLSLAIFDTENKCDTLINSDGSNTVFKIDENYLQEGCDLYIFANVLFGQDLKIGSDLNDFLQHRIMVSGIDIPEMDAVKCFPMMGKLENYDPSANTGSVIEIPLTALYSKVVMNIEVRPDQQVAENRPPRFILNGYEVHNVASSVDFIGGIVNSTDDTTPVLDDVLEVSVESDNVAQGSSSVQFSFYLPERFLQPDILASDYNYPFKKNGSIREEDEIYRQRFKPCLVEGNNPPATFVRFFGEFIDHQDHHYNVSYDVYVGNDNYSNFDIERNTQYNNYITIRGIQTSNDMSDVEGSISIDHRVNIERSQPAIVSLRRETLLDSHFEVRPLRVRKMDVGNVGNINAVKVEVVNPTTTNWMRLERSAGEGTAYKGMKNENGQSIYITDEGPSKGKRKYFTYNLVNGETSGAYDYSLVNSTEVVLPLSVNTECCWIYVDECLEVGDGVRSGLIKVSYGNLNGAIFTPANDTNFPDVYYHINQRKLFQVRGTKSYNIEYHEEYLYNYDADDEYLQTEYEGMVWGLEGIQLSYDEDALFFDSGGSWLDDIFTWLVNYIKSAVGVNPLYDFYIPKHDTDVSSNATKRAYNGYTFCNEIIQVVNGLGDHDTDPNNNIDILQLNQQPRSAIEYCYNKNKRNNKGQVVWSENGINHTENLNWYLPAIDEIEDIVMSEYGNSLKTYSRFLEFQDKFYWSSQPSYIRNHALYDAILKKRGKYYYDDVNYARATSVSYTNGTYDYARSGVTSDYKAIRIYSKGLFSYDAELVEKSPFDGINLGQINRQVGNKPRTSMARVRCVRKQ